MSHTPEGGQADLVAAFEAGRVAGAPAPVERIDTHISHVFLAGDRAFKLKRATRLPFVDFTSGELRRAACEAEIAANKPMAERLYVGAEAVTRAADGRFRIGGGGAIVDWVVIMRRFDQADQFDRLAAAGKLSRDLVEGVAEAIAAAHARVPARFLAGHAADYRHVLRELRRTEEHGAARLGVAAASTLLFERLDAELARMDALIERRRGQGRVRRGHGDLHLRNICVFEGAPTPFDALEFDERLATNDVLYDLAFLLMDLRRAGLAAHANAAMNRYWDAAKESEGALALLPFFMSLRAAVRMAVAVEAGDLAEAQTYRALGAELLERAPATLVAVGGLSGVGKSAVAAALAPRLHGPAGARWLRTDVLRKRRYGLRRDEKAEAAAYAPARRREIYDDLAQGASEALAAGAGVIADATFQDDATRAAIAEAARGARFRAYWLDAPLDVRLSRVTDRKPDASDADRAVAAAQQGPGALAASWRRVDTARPLAAVVAEIQDDLRGCGFI